MLKAYIKNWPLLTILMLMVSFESISQSKKPAIQLHKENSTVWLPQQKITGKVNNTAIKTVQLFHNGKINNIKVNKDGSFSSEVFLREKDNRIWAVNGQKKKLISSDTINLTLGYKPLPNVEPYASVSGKDQIKLHAGFPEKNSAGKNLKFLWEEEKSNPSSVRILNNNDSVASAIIPEKPGIYFFNLHVIQNSDTAKYQTYITRTSDNIKPFKINSSPNLWMDDAVIYQITPFNMVENGTFKDITAKLPELKELGVNTIWLQPIFQSNTLDQGYDVTDYLKLNPAFGNEKDLKALISKAKELELRVVFDVVLNHTSVNHPYAKDRIKKGKGSHYYDFYQHRKDNRAYSSLYKEVENDFVVYFWDELVNLNYDNPEVQQWMTEVLKHWVKEYDIDGYRFDAIWGVQARNSSFTTKMTRELKSIKPDLFLLAEAKGTDSKVYESGFDAAYDWTADTSWVSQWAWEYDLAEGQSLTAFNHPQTEKRDNLLKEALFEDAANAHRKLRFIENNDQARFIEHHGLKRTKMAAALTFSLPGIPMLYNGQEIGVEEHPYDGSAIFLRDKKIKDQGNAVLYNYYKKLIALRKDHPSLSSKYLEEVKISNDESIVAFKRRSGEEEIVIVVNLDEKPAEVKISKNASGLIKDILNEESFSLQKNEKSFTIKMDGFGVRFLQVR